jgi:fermentation-respiration switch protein FrsA (DUF1100 family)
MRRRAVIGLVVVVAALAAAAVCAFYQGSARGLESRKGRLSQALLRPAGADRVSDLFDLDLASTTGESVRAMLRVPSRSAPPHPAVVLVGGVELGRRVAALSGLDDIARYAIIVSPDYPLRVERRAFEGFGLLAAAPRLRAGAFDLVAQVGLQVDYLLSRPDVARGQIFLVGSSFGAPAVVIAGAVDRRPAAVVALYSGGRIGPLVAHVLEQGGPEALPSWRAAAIGRGLALLLMPLEPTRYAGRIAPRPLLMVNGAGDSLIPRECVEALFEAAGEPKEILWLRGEHVQPDERELIGAVSGWLAGWLVRRGLLPPEAGLAGESGISRRANP